MESGRVGLIVESACGALRLLAQSELAIAQLAESTAVEPLVRLLTKGDAQLREVAAALLGTIALHPRGRSHVLATGAAPALVVKLLPLRHEPTQEAAARALKNIAFDTTAAAQVAQAGGMQPLVRLLQSGSPSLHAPARRPPRHSRCSPSTRYDAPISRSAPLSAPPNAR